MLFLEVEQNFVVIGKGVVVAVFTAAVTKKQLKRFVQTTQEKHSLARDQIESTF